MKVVFIGSGNVATHLAQKFQSIGINVSQIYSRTSTNAEALAKLVGATFTTEMSEIETDADYYFYALNDNSLKRFLSKFDLPNAIHLHTAGSISIRIFEKYSTKYGVFYPLQTFSKNKEIDFSTIPICIEASSSEIQLKLEELAKLLTKNVYLTNSEQRKKIHLAAVFACNFTNYMYDMASVILEDAGVSFEIIKPLIKETADKVMTLPPFNAQTGPAVRYDENTIDKHLELLKSQSELKKIYKLLTTDINKRHQKK